jgi:integrase
MGTTANGGRREYNTGSLKERAPGVWRLRIRTIDASGEPVQRQRTFEGDRKSAEQALRKFLNEADDGTTADGALTVGQCLDRWLAHIELRGRRPTTIAENRRKIEKTIRPRLGNLRLAKLSPGNMNDAYDDWLQSGLSPTTVHHLHAIVSAALNHAVRRGDLAVSPAARAEPPRNGSKIPTVPTVEQLGALVRCAAEDDPTFATVILLAAMTGARRGELAALRWSDVDLDAGRITIAKSLTVTGSRTEKIVHIGPTKTRQQRKIALGERGVEILSEHWRSMANLAECVGSPLVDDPYVFARPYHTNGAEPCLPDTWTTKFSVLCEKAGVGHFRFHDLRHWNATQLIGAGADVRTVSGRLGHAQTSMTLDRYAHALPAADAVVAEVVGMLYLLSGRTKGAPLAARVSGCCTSARDSRREMLDPHQPSRRLCGTVTGGLVGDETVGRVPAFPSMPLIASGPSSW